MSLLGERVKHQVFGEGKIVSVTKNYVTVSFEIGKRCLSILMRLRSF